MRRLGHGRFVTWDERYAAEHPEMRLLLESFVSAALDAQPANCREFGAKFFCRSRSELQWEIWRSRGRLHTPKDGERRADAERSRQALIDARQAYYNEKSLELQRAGADGHAPRGRPQTADQRGALPRVRTGRSGTQNTLLIARKAYFAERRRLLADMPLVPNSLVFDWTEASPSSRGSQRASRPSRSGGSLAPVQTRPFTAPASAAPLRGSSYAGSGAVERLPAIGGQRSGGAAARTADETQQAPEGAHAAPGAMGAAPPTQAQAQAAQRPAVERPAVVAPARVPVTDVQTLSNQWFEMSMLLRGACAEDAVQFDALRTRVASALTGLSSIERAAQRSGANVGQLFQALLQRLNREGGEFEGGINRDAADYTAATNAIAALTANAAPVPDAAAAAAEAEAAASSANRIADRIADRIAVGGGDAESAWKPLATAAEAARSLVRIKLEDANDLLAARQALEFCVHLFTDIEARAASTGKGLDATLALLE